MTDSSLEMFCFCWKRQQWESALCVPDETGCVLRCLEIRSRLQGDTNLSKTFPGQDKSIGSRTSGGIFLLASCWEKHAQCFSLFGRWTPWRSNLERSDLIGPTSREFLSWETPPRARLESESEDAETNYASLKEEKFFLSCFPPNSDPRCSSSPARDISSEHTLHFSH